MLYIIYSRVHAIIHQTIVFVFNFFYFHQSNKRQYYLNHLNHFSITFYLILLGNLYIYMFFFIEVIYFIILIIMKKITFVLFRKLIHYLFIIHIKLKNSDYIIFLIILIYSNMFFVVINFVVIYSILLLNNKLFKQ